MTELKKGDKVTHGDSEFWPGEYTLVDDAVNSTVEVRDKGDRSFYFTIHRLTKVQESGPKVGDRVRLVHEGVVTSTSGAGEYKAICIDGVARFVDKGETVEILERAPEPVEPFPVGTVVKTLIPSSPLVKTTVGWRWRGEEETVFYSTDAEVREAISTDPTFEVIYEPPQSA